MIRLVLPVVALCFYAQPDLESREGPILDARGKMLMEIIDTLERDLEQLSRKRREFLRRKDQLESQLARLQERSLTVERQLGDSSRQIEKLLRSMVQMKEPDDLLLFFSTMEYHDLHVYKRVIREITVGLSQRLGEMVGEKKALDRRRHALRRKAETLDASRKTLLEEIEAVELVARRTRTELTERTKKIAAIESLFMTTEFQSPYLNSGAGEHQTGPGPEPEDLGIHLRKRELRIPVSPGQLIKNFEELPQEPYGTEKMVRGWLLVPFVKGKKKGAQGTAFVRVPHPGAVVFVGEIPGFGLTLVVDHGHGYHTVYSNLFRVHVIKGDALTRDQTIATIKSHDPPKVLPYLYFELRRQRIAVDPKPWFRLRPLEPEER